MQLQHILETNRNQFDITKWLYQLFADLEMARKIKVSPDRRLYIARELDNCGYTQENALYAEYWLKWGDWSMKGNDPTLVADDFFPSKAQHESGYAKRHMQPILKSQTPQLPNPNKMFSEATEEQKKALAKEFNRHVESKYGKFDIPWIRQYDTDQSK